MPRPAVPTLLAIAAVGAAGLALRPGPPHPRVERVILLGFDGVAPNLIAPLVEEGRLPAIRRLMGTGSYGPLRSALPTKSAILWTSIATGKQMLKHGIVDWTYVNRAGIHVPYQDRKRRVKTYWEILAERGFQVGTLNWWVSYPPPPVPNSFLVSNAFKGRGTPDSVYPPELFAPLDALRLPLSDLPAVLQQQRLREWNEAEAAIPIIATRNLLDSYGFYILQDMTIDRASDYLWEHRPVQVFSTYFRLPDVTSHLADHWLDRALYEETMRREGAHGLRPEDEARIDRAYARLLAPVYELMDRTIAKYAARMDDHTLLVVCSDHGFRFFRGAYSHANPGQSPPDGVIFLAGPGIRRGQRLEDAVLYDVAPTILYAMGQPVPADMDGKLLRSAFEESYLRWWPPRTVATYEAQPRPTAAGESAEVDRDVLQDLGTIGYIEVPRPAAPAPASR